MKEYGGLSDFGLFEILVGAVKHQIGDAETEDFVGFFKHLAGHFVGFVEVLAHAHKLCALAGEYKCFHNCL